MFCPKCGKALSDDANFCSFCGAAFANGYSSAGGARTFYAPTDCGGLKRAAKASLQDNWWNAVGILLLYSVIAGIVSWIWLLFAGVMSFGVALYFLHLSRGQQASFSDLLAGFDYFGTTCLVGIKIMVFTFLWSLLLIIPGIIKAYSYSQTFYILADNPQMESDDAITLSSQMMKGHKLDLFILQLSFIGWFLLSALTFGLLALFYVSPYLNATYAHFYESVRSEYEQRMKNEQAAV